MNNNKNSAHHSFSFCGGLMFWWFVVFVVFPPGWLIPFVLFNGLSRGTATGWTTETKLSSHLKLPFQPWAEGNHINVQCSDFPNSAGL